MAIFDEKMRLENGAKERSALCRSRRELSNEYLLAKIAHVPFDSARALSKGREQHPKIQQTRTMTQCRLT